MLVDSYAVTYYKLSNTMPKCLVIFTFFSDVYQFILHKDIDIVFWQQSSKFNTEYSSTVVKSTWPVIGNTYLFTKLGTDFR